MIRTIMHTFSSSYFMITLGRSIQPYLICDEDECHEDMISGYSLQFGTVFCKKTRLNSIIFSANTNGIYSYVQLTKFIMVKSFVINSRIFNYLSPELHLVRFIPEPFLYKKHDVMNCDKTGILKQI
jgi:hypothetical protein